MQSDSEKLVDYVPQAYRKFLVRKGSEFEGLVGVEIGQKFIDLSTTSFFEAVSLKMNPKKRQLDLTALHALPNLEHIDIECATIKIEADLKVGLQSVRTIKLHNCRGSQNIFGGTLPNLETVHIDQCDFFDLTCLLKYPKLEFVRLEQTPINRIFDPSAPSWLDRFNEIFLSWPMPNPAHVERQIQELEKRAISVSFT